jgi:hypothetical protein
MATGLRPLATHEASPPSAPNAPEEAMNNEQKSVQSLPEAPKLPRKAGGVDLSTEIAAHVERQPGDAVKCRRIDGDSYRCNWWAAQPTASYDNPGMYGLLVTTHRVRKSQFLRVTKSPTRGLVIQVVGDRTK